MILPRPFSITRAAVCAAPRLTGSIGGFTDDFKICQELEIPIAQLSSSSEQTISRLIVDNPQLLRADRTLHIALACGLNLKGAIKDSLEDRCGVSIGCSRGATGLFEQRYNQWQIGKQRLSSSTSPFTTAGTLSSYVAADLGCSGFNISHSMTCSSSLQAITNALAWLISGFCTAVVAGGVEAPLTPFTITQMKALKIYTEDTNTSFPCAPCKKDAIKNSFVLGEGGGLFHITDLAEHDALATIRGIGFCQEVSSSLTGISATGEGFQTAMAQALTGLPAGESLDLIILHCPGTIQGDQAELAAVKALFHNRLPAIFSNKWQTGHTLGASGALSIFTALEALATGIPPEFPYQVPWPNNAEILNGREVKSVLVNAAGFGGNVSSLLLTRH